MPDFVLTPPKGMRDFAPDELAKRNYIKLTIADTFCSFGYSEIETSAMERLETLIGKYGDEGDRLIFKVLDNGRFFEKVTESNQDIAGLSSKDLTPHISSKALKYDLTVPFARFVANKINTITFPFKRFQIQPVWRADRPQKGRYREFLQCDADIIGSDSLWNEVELIEVLRKTFAQLQLKDSVIKINSRKILAGIAEVLEVEDKLTAFTVALDKIDKIGAEKVKAELQLLNVKNSKVLEELLHPSDNNAERLEWLTTILQESETGKKGLAEVHFVLEKSKNLDEKDAITLDYTLARGLDYYTGCIIEVQVTNSGVGSLAGGGRYDNLTGIFGLEGISGTGISFGLDRIYQIMESQNLFPEATGSQIDFFMVNFGEDYQTHANKLANTLRKHNYKVFVYPDAVKLKKQMVLANALKAKKVLLIGPDEWAEKTATIKDMQTGKQTTVLQDKLIG